MAALHSVDYRAAGLGDYGRPGNYFARQIARWSQEYLDDDLAGHLPDMDALVAWLPDAIPAGCETCIVHGDYCCDNMIFHPTQPRVLAVLYWKLSTLAHPLSDFAYHAMMYRMPGDIVAGLGGLDQSAHRSGLYRHLLRPNWVEPHRGLGLFLAFNFFRLAAIFHGIKGRVLRGTASNAQAKERAEALPRLAALAREVMENDQ